MRRIAYKIRRRYTEVLWKQDKYDPKVFWGMVLPFCLYFICMLLFSGETKPVWTFFSDAGDYIRQSRFSLFSTDFFAPLSNKWFNARPFTLPFFYKFVGSDPFRMVVFQKLLYCIFTGTLIVVLVRKLPRIVILRWGFVIYFLFFFSWWNILGWSTNLLSEFISLSFLFLWLAVTINYLLKQNMRNTIVLMVVTFFFSFTRDNWMYFLLSFFVINFLMSVLYMTERRMNTAMVLIVYLLIFWFQDKTVYTTKRYTLPVFNSIALRVSQNPSYLRWFKEKGMPRSEFLRDEFKDAYADSSAVREFMYRAYEDTANTRVLNWIRKEGKSQFSKFVVEHPSYVFMFDQSDTQIDRIYAHNVKYYYVAPSFSFLGNNSLLPIFNNWIFVLLLAGCGTLWYQFRQKIFLLPFLFTALTIVNVFISYNADALEVDRHMVPTVILREFIGMFTLIIMVNKWFAWKKAKREEALR